jgi:hypothetical protein
MKRLLTLGIPVSPGPGAGSHRMYGEDELAQLLLAFEFEQLDIDPKAVAILIKKWWQPLFRGCFREIERVRRDNFFFLWLNLNFVGSPRRDEFRGVPKFIGGFTLHSTGPGPSRPQFEETLLPRLTGHHTPPGATADEFPPRLGIVNLSLQWYRLQDALTAKDKPTRRGGVKADR